MQDRELADFVFPIFRKALSLRDRLLRGETTNPAQTQAALSDVLLNDLDGRWPAYSGGDSLAPTKGPRFLGARYAITCWIDELLTRRTPWSDIWPSYNLEQELYGTACGADQFWEQARLAEDYPDAVEAFFLCVMLGFRGRVKPQTLQRWVADAQARFTGALQLDWKGPGELLPPVNVPPLDGRLRLGRLGFVCSLLVLSLLPLAVFWFVRQLGH